MSEKKRTIMTGAQKAKVALDARASAYKIRLKKSHSL